MNKGEKFIEENEEIAEAIYDAIPEEGKSSQAIRTALSNEKHLISKMNDNIDDYKDKASIETIKGKPKKIVEKAEDQLHGIDDDVLELLSTLDKKSISKVLNRIKLRIEELEVILNVE